MVNDPIADMLTRIRNAQKAGHSTVSAPASKMKKQILDILKNEGYIADFETTEDKGRKNLLIQLKYDKNGSPVIHSIDRISKPGIRKYVSYSEVKPVMGGMGISVLTTNKGILTNREAKKLKIGGELICRVW